MGGLKKSPALRVQCGPFIPLLIISASLAGGLPDGNLHTDRAVYALPAQEIFLNFQVCVNMEVLPEQLCMNFLH